MPVLSKSQIEVADEVWIAVALLHREQPAQADFAVAQIVERARKEALAGSLRPGVYLYATQHGVANRPPNPGRYRILFETAPGRRRLYRIGDPYHPAREGAKTAPAREELPYGYEGLLAWYHDWCSTAAGFAPESDPLLSLAGSGKAVWADEPADEYVRRLREGWE